jgi:CheY-like chemotaxis protein
VNKSGERRGRTDTKSSTVAPLKILLIEDDPDHAELVLRCLTGHDVANSVVHVRDGETGLDYLLRRGAYADPETSPRPHLVLLDLRLPALDGSEVLRIVKTTEDVKRIPVVILTSSEAEKDLVGAYENHANSYLVKPIRYESFVQLIDELGYYWLARNRDAGPDR